MNTYKCVSFNTPCYFNTHFYVELTETDSEATFQNFLEDALTSFENYVVDGIIDDVCDENGENGELVLDWEDFDRIRENCYIEDIHEVSKNEIPPTESIYTTDDGEHIEF